MNEKNLINTDIINELRDQVGDAFDRLVDRYVQETMISLKEIEACFLAKDLKGVSSISHNLKSSSGTFGIEAIRSLSSQLEYNIENLSESEIESHIHEIKDIFLQVKDILKQV